MRGGGGEEEWTGMSAAWVLCAGCALAHQETARGIRGGCGPGGGWLRLVAVGRLGCCRLGGAAWDRCMVTSWKGKQATTTYAPHLAPTLLRLGCSSAALTSAIFAINQIPEPSNSRACATGHLLRSSAYSAGGSAPRGRANGNCGVSSPAGSPGCCDAAGTSLSGRRRVRSSPPAGEQERPPR